MNSESFTKIYIPQDQMYGFNYVQTSEERVLSDHERNVLDGPITISELKSALWSMENSKCPGLDGLPKEFYTTFWSNIQQLLYDNYMYAFKKGELNDSARRGVLTLIPKKDKNLVILKNWRPLTMLNLDYKILAKTIADRFKNGT